MPVRALRAFNAGCVLFGSLCIGCATRHPPQSENVAAESRATADTELRDFHLRALEARIPTIPEGPERDYFSGMLAVRSGHFDDAIHSTMTFSLGAPKTVAIPAGQ